MEERFEEIEAGFKELKEANISHDELGSANGFHDAETAKNESCDFAIQLIEKIQRNHESLNLGVIDEGFNHLNGSLNRLTQFRVQIEQTVSQGIHNNNFPGQRASQITDMQSEAANLRRAHTLEIALRVVELEKTIGDEEALKNLQQNLEQQVAKAEKAAKDAATITDTLRGKAAETGVSVAEGAFQNLSSTHEKREGRWFYAFLGSSVAFVIIVGCIVFTSTFEGTVSEVVYEIFKRLLLLSAAGLGIRITLGKYNLERNLRIIYDHRSSTLQQFEVFEKAISDDLDAKNQLRLEVARYVFSDPDTGYRGSSSSHELNINPILNTVEKATTKGI